MASDLLASSPARRKSRRRSWFSPTSSKPLAFEIAREPIRKEAGIVEDEEVETLLLNHFAAPPRVDFGIGRVGKSRVRHLRIHNPTDFEQRVVLEKFPHKKQFVVDQEEFMVGSGDDVYLTLKWTPDDPGNCREMVLFKVEDIYRLTAILFGRTEELPKPKKKAAYHPPKPFTVLHSNKKPSSMHMLRASRAPLTSNPMNLPHTKSGHHKRVSPKKVLKKSPLRRLRKKSPPKPQQLVADECKTDVHGGYEVNSPSKCTQTTSLQTKDEVPSYIQNVTPEPPKRRYFPDLTDEDGSPCLSTNEALYSSGLPPDHSTCLEERKVTYCIKSPLLAPACADALPHEYEGTDMRRMTLRNYSPCNPPSPDQPTHCNQFVKPTPLSLHTPPPPTIPVASPEQLSARRMTFRKKKKVPTATLR